MKKIAIQGVAGAFHDEAAKKFFGQDIELVECSSFRILCQHIKMGTADYAVMAIENTIAGSLLQNYGYLDEFSLHIVGEVYLRISMNLMALPGTMLRDLTSISSHPIALRQCGDFLASLPPCVKVTESDDTAESAKLIFQEQKKNAGAIAGLAAAHLYHLEIIERGIESNPENYTRFLVISPKKEVLTDANKASLAFEIDHQTGSLAEILTLLAAHRINLTKIQSVPILGRPYQYAFHVDVEWETQLDFEKSMTIIQPKLLGLTVYGMYKKGTPVNNFQ